MYITYERSMFNIDTIEIVCPFCKGELNVIKGDKNFGVLKCNVCNELFPLGNYFPGIPDLRPKDVRISLYERAWFNTFGVKAKGTYIVDVNKRVNELPYYEALIMEKHETKYHSILEMEFLDPFKYIDKVLCIGCRDGRELRLIGKTGIGVDLYPSSVILSNSLGTKTLLADLIQLPFKDGSFNGVLALESLEYVPIDKTESALKEISRVLTPNSIVFMSLEKPYDKSSEDKEYNITYESEYLTVKRHFHRGWGTKGLESIKKHFKIIELREDENYYYVMATKKTE